MRRAVLFLAIGLLAGCVDQLAARQARLSQFVGQPEPVLVQQMGVPNRTYETGGVKYLAYVEHRVDLVPGFSSYNPLFPGWGFYPGWDGGGLPTQVIELRCETTFQVADGTVKSFTLRGNACG
jgi:hypothetical protein